MRDCGNGDGEQARYISPLLRDGLNIGHDLVERLRAFADGRSTRRWQINLDYGKSKGVRESAMATKAAKKTTGSKSKPKATSKGRAAKPKAKKRAANKKGVVAKVAGSIASAVASVMPGGKKKK